MARVSIECVSSEDLAGLRILQRAGSPGTRISVSALQVEEDGGVVGNRYALSNRDHKNFRLS